MWRPALTACAAGLTVCLAALPVAERPATAQEFTFHVEDPAAFWLDEPQSSRFTPGYYLALRPGIALGPVVALQATYAMLFTPAGEGFTEDGSMHSVLAGLRLRPLAEIQPTSDQLGGLFVDFNAGYVRTENLDRFGFDGGVGYGFQVASWFSLGPVVRYAQIVQPDDAPNQDPNDAQFLSVGLDLAFGPAHQEVAEREEEVAEWECPAAPYCALEEEVVAVACADWDKDSVCNVDDNCPDEIGPPATLGCAIDPCSGAPLLLLVQFPYDSAELPRPVADDPQTMDPVLDAVAEAIAQDPSCRVCILGHASEEGPAGHNEDLSRSRASAVQGYMSARGLDESRMPTIGMGATCQLVPESTRPLNRRVEFLRLEEGQSCPTECSE